MTLNESPSEKEGKYVLRHRPHITFKPSMKVPPKRKGNFLSGPNTLFLISALNESPSEKEGKSTGGITAIIFHAPSMKVPPKRKGNPR